MIIIYTNCQGGVGHFPYFKSRWPDTKYYANYKCPSEIIPDDEIEKCDIFIYMLNGVFDYKRFSKTPVTNQPTSNTITSTTNVNVVGPQGPLGAIDFNNSDGFFNHNVSHGQLSGIRVPLCL